MGAVRTTHRGRRHFRFRVEPESTAILSLEDRAGAKKVAALIENESYSGCCLVILNGPALRYDQVYRIRIARGLELRAEVRWMKRLGGIALQVGFEYVD